MFPILNNTLGKWCCFGSIGSILHGLFFNFFIVHKMAPTINMQDNKEQSHWQLQKLSRKIKKNEQINNNKNTHLLKETETKSFSSVFHVISSQYTVVVIPFFLVVEQNDEKFGGKFRLFIHVKFDYLFNY